MLYLKIFELKKKSCQNIHFRMDFDKSFLWHKSGLKRSLSQSESENESNVTFKRIKFKRKINAKGDFAHKQIEQQLKFKKIEIIQLN